MAVVDVAIVGGGPAGLSAALHLGRACRQVVVIDNAEARNMAAGVVQGFLTQDGVAIDDLRKQGWADLDQYDVVGLTATVTRVEPGEDSCLLVQVEGHPSITARSVLWAAGVTSVLTDLPGVSDLWGKRVFECPYCHGWEHRDSRIAVYGGGDDPSICLASLLKSWSSDITYFTGGRSLEPEEEASLSAARVVIDERQVLGLHETASGVALRGREASEDFSAVFMHMGNAPRTKPLHDWLGVHSMEDVQVDERGRTSVPGLYVAGDAGKNMFAAVPAAASGVLAAMAITTDLVKRRFPGSF